jgi:hypothetical protein
VPLKLSLLTRLAGLAELDGSLEEAVQELDGSPEEAVQELDGVPVASTRATEVGLVAVEEQSQRQEATAAAPSRPPPNGTAAETLSPALIPFVSKSSPAQATSRLPEPEPATAKLDKIEEREALKRELAMLESRRQTLQELRMVEERQRALFAQLQELEPGEP